MIIHEYFGYNDLVNVDDSIMQSLHQSIVLRNLIAIAEIQSLDHEASSTPSIWHPVSYNDHAWQRQGTGQLIPNNKCMFFHLECWVDTGGTLCEKVVRVALTASHYDIFSCWNCFCAYACLMWSSRSKTTDGTVKVADLSQQRTFHVHMSLKVMS